jgi:hypothetical protein
MGSRMCANRRDVLLGGLALTATSILGQVQAPPERY